MYEIFDLGRAGFGQIVRNARLWVIHPLREICDLISPYSETFFFLIFFYDHSIIIIGENNENAGGQI